MRTVDLKRIFPALFLAVCLAFFTSCASNDDVTSDDLLSEASGVSSEMEETDSSDEEMAAVEEEVTEDVSEDGEEELAVNEEESDEEMEDTEVAETEDFDGESAEDFAANATEDGLEGEPSEGIEAVQDADTTLAVNESLETSLEESSTDFSEPTLMDPALEEVASTETTTSEQPVAPVARAFKRAPSSAPAVRDSAFSKNGQNLNRYYFARNGDSAESVSELLYGSTDRAEELSQNNPQFSAGSVIYYSSPVDSQDNEMHSFYEDNNVTQESYEVAQGDWLSTIAQERHGHLGTWKEIAYLNGMSNPDSISAGQTIQVYPQDLTPFSRKVQLTAQVSQESSDDLAPVVAQNEPVQQINTKDRTYSGAATKMTVAKLDTPKADQKTVQASADVGSFFKRHFIVFLILAALALVGVIVYALRQGEKL